jgi:hypothetical protein
MGDFYLAHRSWQYLLCHFGIYVPVYVLVWVEVMVCLLAQLASATYLICFDNWNNTPGLYMYEYLISQFKANYRPTFIHICYLLCSYRSARYIIIHLEVAV